MRRPGRKSTPGQRSRQYMQMHRDSGYTGLPDEHRESREEIMRQLERQDEGVRERALVGGPKHFDRPLTKDERSYQQHWQREEGLDVGDVERRRKDLGSSSPKPRGRRSQGAGRRHQPPGGRRRSSFRRVAAPVTSSPTGEAAASGAGLFWEMFAGGIVLSLLLLVLSSKGTKVTSGILGGITGAFARLADPSSDLFGPSTKKVAAKASVHRTGGAGAPLVGGLGLTNAQVLGVGSGLPDYSNPASPATVTPTIP